MREPADHLGEKPWRLGVHTLQGGEWEEVDKRCDSIDEVLRIGSMHELVSMNYKLYVLFCLRMFEVL